MSTDRFKLLDRSELLRYREPADQLAFASWPEFIWHDTTAKEYWHELFDRFDDYQALLLDATTDRVAAIGHSLPFRWEEELSNLPENGWDWVIQKAVQDHKNSLEPNMQAAILVASHTEYQSQGLSTNILRALRSLGKSRGFENLIVPVRPNEKAKYPLISIDDYLTWQTEEGLPFDAWLRVHARLGGKIIKACHYSKTVRGTRAEWEAWTGMRFPQSGRYIVPGALGPLSMNLEKDEAVYIEPNVWMAHEIG